MANFKKIDDHDFIFVNRPLTEREENEFSNFLKARKSKKKEAKFANDFPDKSSSLDKGIMFF